MALTWGEFKEMVERALKEQERDDSTEIEYIDISWPDKTAHLGLPNFDIFVTDQGMMAIH
jgi:hypothetical protein